MLDELKRNLDGAADGAGKDRQCYTHIRSFSLWIMDRDKMRTEEMVWIVRAQPDGNDHGPQKILKMKPPDQARVYLMCASKKRPDTNHAHACYFSSTPSTHIPGCCYLASLIQIGFFTADTDRIHRARRTETGAQG